MNWITEPEDSDNQYLNVNNRIGKDKDGDVEPFFKYQPNETAGPKMIWREWNLNVPFKK